MKRTTAILLILATLLGILCACTGEGDVTTGPDENSTEEPTVVYDVALADLGQYKIIRSESASTALVNEILELKKAMDKKFSVDLGLKNDLYSETVPSTMPTEYEILVGDTNREESKQVLSSLRADDYIYTVVEKKVIITAHSDENTVKAIEKFISEVVNKAEGEKLLTSKQAFTYKAEYSCTGATLDGKNISDYKIVYANRNRQGERDAAERLAGLISEKLGFVLEVYPDSELQAGENEILIGETDRETGIEYTPTEGKYYIAKAPKGVSVLADSKLSYMHAVSALIGDNTSGEVKLEVGNGEAAYTPIKLTAMSFNVWVSSYSVARADRVAQRIKEYSPDTIGFQETSPTWMDYLSTKLSDEYAYVGIGRDGVGKGESNPVFYKKAVFELLEEGTKWLSDTPDKISKYESSSLNRVFTYAKLKHKESGQVVLIVNTHLEHTSSEAREDQIKVICRFLQEYGAYPTVLTGDFNCQVSEAPIRYLLSNTALKNSMNLAAKKEMAYTFESSSKVIDFAFVDPTYMFIDHYKVATGKINGEVVSDHNALIIEYSVYPD